MILALLPSCCGAQTILSGNISGTWQPSGNPYIISANATVPNGQTLTIQPGVTVWIAQGISITVNGGIQAVGTSLQHITFQAPISSQYWNTLSVNNGLTNLFSYCDFANATNSLAFVGTSSNQVNYCTFTNAMGTALTFNNQSSNEVLFSTFQNVNNGIGMVVNGDWTHLTLRANIMNCSFSNCWGQAVSGAANAGVLSATNICAIENCSFNAVGSGCSFNVSDNSGFATANLQIQNNIFDKVTNTAISLTSSYGAVGQATLINNIILSANNGVISQDRWDATVMDNVIMGCTNAITDTGSLSRNVEYNDFFHNATNFIGYTSDYGTVVFVNHNGTPCDLLFNIYQNPLFIATNDFTLQTNSPCIDAGTPNVAYMDMSFPPSQGTGLPDLGICGGPLAVNWLPVIPSAPAPILLSASRAIRLSCTDVLERGSYQIQSSTHWTNWTDYGSPFYITTTSNFVQYVDATNRAEFFRLQSLP
jgi:uncharacterized protein YaiE (UPF0345 family)